MGLSNDLISQFIKATNDKKETKSEKTVYGTMVKYNGINYVKIDGSDLLTPVSSTTFTEDGERVTVTIKNHTAMVTGNISSPSARNTDVSDINKQISEFGTLMSYKINTKDLDAVNATIESLKAKVATISGIESINADIENLQAEFSKLTYVDADKVEALNADIENLKVKFGDFANISAEDLEVINGHIEQLYGYTADFTYVSADMLSAIKADIKNADITHANIDFTNITKAAIENFISESGLIQNLVVGDAHVTGDLVGVTISGDLIKANTLAADKLMLKGEDGLYYKLNLDGVKVEAEQTEYNSINGSILAAKSVTASKINVTDLVAFGATIGGFKIADTSIYSGLKESVDNTIRGIYLDDDGQVAFGDENHFVKFFKDTDDAYKLMISGAITANGKFKILTDGSIEAVDGMFKGTVEADAGTIAGISISDGSLSTMVMDADNIPTGFQLNSDGSFVSKGGSNYNYVYNLAVKSGTLQLSSFYSPSGSNASGAIINASGMFFKEGDSSGQTLGSIYQDLGGELYLTSEHSNIILKANGLTKIQNGLSVGKLVGGYYQSVTNEGQGSSGYLNIAEIKLSGTHQNGLIEMEIARRGDNHPTRFFIRFANANNTDPSLDIFDVFDSATKLYIAKTATATWNIYVPKSEAYDSVAILYAHYNGIQMGSDVITYKSEFVSSLPTGYVTSSYASGFSGYHYSNVYTFLSSGSMIRGRSGDGGFDFYFKEGGMRIVFDGTNGKIWKVDTSGTWTTLAG